jgi:solute:Na+ symporter, SSS family
LTIVRQCLVALALVTSAGCGKSTAPDTFVDANLRAESIAKLRAVLETQPKWVKVHAAEWLLDLSYPQGVVEEFDKELAAHGDEPEYRIGIWRVLARASQHNRDHSRWDDRIKQAFFDERSPDRVHAAEAMAKLGLPLTPNELSSVANAAEGADGRLASYCRWVLAVADKKNLATHLDALIELLESPALESRQIAAYALRHLGSLNRNDWRKVIVRAEQEPDSLTKLRLQGVALIAAPADAAPAELDSLRASLTQALSPEDARFDGELSRLLADVGQIDVLPRLITYIHADAPIAQDTASAVAMADLSASAANAILRIDRRLNRHGIHWLDWAVIAAYALAMMWVGVYYSRHVKSRDDYLLGGRTMKPWMVGLSLFATIISTLTYLAYPGELIRYGPLALSSVLGLPFAYLAVGWWLIPSLMAASGTSGYALLEERLGVGVRLLGASVFLLIRFVWMAAIIYATSTIALLPVLGVDPAYSPLICVILGCVTLGYTSMGGLRAVVMTDVIQSFLLFGGAIVALVLITLHFGGLQWFPTSWPSHWQHVSWGFGFQERITVGNATAYMLAWYICTCGSDQMAIQRFKATRNVAAARRSFGVTLVATFLVKALLGLVGVAVMAYFFDQPHHLPDRATVLTNADQMFPSFIVVAIPAGLTGLVISGMMAAAMSSLSSGISASASVISDDFIKRFRGLPATERRALTEERILSAIIGAMAVALSLLIGNVPGNLFEITSRIVNALVAPLFVLFFMAMYVPWSTSFGAVVGLIASSAVAIAIALFQISDISMMWIVPASMLVGIFTGCLASLIPNGKRVGGGESPHYFDKRPLESSVD